MNLRPYQETIISHARGLMREGCHSILIQSPTGSGKTLLTAHMVGTCVSKRMRAFFVVHRHELILQSSATFKMLRIRHGIISPGFQQDFHAPVQIASIQTLARRWHRFPMPNLIVWDEAHHFGARTWQKLHTAYPKAFHVGLTATPCRLDGQGLGSWFKTMIQGPTVRWLIDNKFLADYRLYAPTTVDLTRIHHTMGDYARDELDDLMDKPKITGDAIAHYKKFCYGKRAIVFAVSIQHSRNIVDQFIQQGFNAAHIDGDTPALDRERAIQLFREGNIQILSNVELFGEGFDVPAMEAAILLRPTESLALYLQQVGRALRPWEGKTHALILDHVGNCARFGLPDTEREWSLESVPKRESIAAPAVRICSSCFGAQNFGGTLCIFCGALFPLKPRQVDQVAGELREIDRDQLLLRLRYKRDQQKARSFDDLVKLGKSRGYKRPHAWAAMLLKVRQAKRLKVA